ncbi:phospholipid/cholesterol/gamma-HCH transport system ATP-binding protein [Actinokineospora alba]|uniref:Phospholipid/cholesterol/gamma-HCH transport system ATP-binding protein n=1 Tax=Actinokineospora alba TaxID=504798 RepID=A0A1H0VA19_9PSEU|nr:ABC transporter ATP-binding protein [Actinokineospora alba]TDP65552.1 phospholipid/cholesterol/gamma-HCH transport system ATP-binding protein [Actinokineospora alba]SDH65143.1 phospholipid/cholesterol/gamma-HCH transport system ATP-binding protein [Actinokineospora alba]SDP74926.1 phospholipid/cholesterol/gamma-HCH transport system ATP-binding protein [Actinokineospora alba]
MGAEVVIEGLTKSFGKQAIWRDVTLTLPPGEVSVMLGPSGTGKSVFLKSMIGLLKPDRGKCVINGVDIVTCSEAKLYETRKLFGVLFQDGALFGSMNLYDNVAFPLREHTKKSEAEIKRIVLEKLELTGLSGAEKKLPGEISGGMRKRAGLARALVLDPEIILCDEPDSGLDPVRTAYLSQLLIDLNAQIDATILIVTHNINLARTVPDNLGMLFRKELVMFGPREVLLTSDEPVVEQFLNGRRLGPIGMSEEKDAAQMAREQAHADAGHSDGSSEEDVRGVVPQIEPTPGMPERAGVRRRKDRVMRILNTLPHAAQEGIIESLTDEERARYGVHSHMVPANAAARPRLDQPTQNFQPVQPSPRPRPVEDPPRGFQGDLADPQVARLPETNWKPPGGAS